MNGCSNPLRCVTKCEDAPFTCFANSAMATQDWKERQNKQRREKMLRRQIEHIKTVTSLTGPTNCD